jgi:hypothetical protein
VDELSHVVIHRRPDHSPEGDGRREQISIDFVVNGLSLLNELVKRSGGHSDFMGCLCKGLSELREAAIARLRVEAVPDTETGRVILYMCPECGDIGCGSYSTIIESIEGEYVWRSFAYENGYEPAAPVEDLGPFFFAKKAYRDALSSAESAL